MNILHNLSRLHHVPTITGTRMAVALIAAVIADGLQIFLQAVPFAPQGIDVVAAVIVNMAIGFHILLLPTFVIELIPVIDDLPTWTGCVLAVIALRKRQDQVASAEIPTAPSK